MNIGQGLIAVASFLTGLKALKEALEPEQPLAKGPDPWERLPDLPRLPGPPPRAQVHRVKNISQRVHYVEQQIIKGRRDPRIRGLAVQIVSKKCNGSWCIPERDFLGELRAIFTYTRQNVRYVRDPIDRDTFQHPVRTLQWGGEDCDGATIVLGSLAGAIGYPVKMRVIQTVNSNDYDHIYLIAGVPPHAPTHWLPLDASVNKPAFWEAPTNLVRRKRDYAVR